ncbi:MAG: exosortase T [Stappiaceae bacterium]
MVTSYLKNPVALSFAGASLILALEPMLWLGRTWIDSSYQSHGYVYGILILLLIGWSASSRVEGDNRDTQHHAILLLVLSALIRFASQIFAINILGGLALAIDIFAILTLLNMPHRKRPLSAFWVAFLFLFSLPIERVLQRLLGYPMQELSAAGACQLLGMFFEDLACEGIRIQVAGQDVLVDLPCSGTASLMLSGAMFVVLSALYRPRMAVALLWAGLTIFFSIIGNAVRISVLAFGLVYQESLFGLDVMVQPLHDIIGYATVLLSLLPLLIFYRPSPAKPWRWSFGLRVDVSKSARAAAAAGFVCLATVVVFLPRQALDVSRTLVKMPMPMQLLGHARTDQQLLPMESAYFEQYGGTAQKALYGPVGLTLVQTTSPLRHLHSPEDCLRGLGYTVEFLGTRFEPAPTALFRAEGPKGDAWHVAVSYASSSGFTSSNVAEAVWHWLKHPGGEWTSIQRITPWNMDDAERLMFETAAVAALDLTAPLFSEPRMTSAPIISKKQGNSS